MAKETRPSSLSRVIRSRRTAVAAAGVTEMTIPAKVSKFLCQNSGANPIRINFNDDAAGQYWMLQPGQSLPTAIDISDRATMHIRAEGGASEIQCILWS